MSPDSLHEKKKDGNGLRRASGEAHCARTGDFFKGQICAAGLKGRVSGRKPAACKTEDPLARTQKARTYGFGLTPLWRQARQSDAASLLDSPAAARIFDAARRAIPLRAPNFGTSFLRPPA